MYIVYVHNATMGRVFFFFRGVKEFSFIVLSSPIHPVRPTDSHPPAYKKCRPKLCGIIIYCDGTLLALLFFYSFFFLLKLLKRWQGKVRCGLPLSRPGGFWMSPLFFINVYTLSLAFSQVLMYWDKSVGQATLLGSGASGCCFCFLSPSFNQGVLLVSR